MSGSHDYSNYCLPDVGSSEQATTIFTDGQTVKAIGIHSSFMGSLDVKGQPELTGISVGTPVQELLKKAKLKLGDAEFYWSGPGGPTLCFEERLPRLIFEIDCT